MLKNDSKFNADSNEGASSFDHVLSLFKPEERGKIRSTFKALDSFNNPKNKLIPSQFLYGYGNVSYKNIDASNVKITDEFVGQINELFDKSFEGIVCLSTALLKFDTLTLYQFTDILVLIGGLLFILNNSKKASHESLSEDGKQKLEIAHKKTEIVAKNYNTACEKYRLQEGKNRISKNGMRG